MTARRVLLTSPIQPIGGCSPDVYSWNKRPGALRLFLCFLNHPGLGFLKANLPVDILEYPSRRAFEEALETRPDVVGISFHINETEIALDMARQARARGVKEVWAGNYGADSPEITSAFDRVFRGWSEVAAAQALALDNRPGPLVHPELYGAFGTNLATPVILSGTLYTSRGCPWTCNFCQTPDFYGKPQPIPLDEIKRIIGVYHARGVRAINILDENFGTFRSHANRVVELLHRYGMRWIALTRVDTLTKNFDHWQAHGLMGAHLGIESLNADSLGGAGKRVEQQCTLDLLRRMSSHNMFVQAFYILGFEEDTVASIQRDILELARLDVDLVQVQILTTYPGTAQRKMIEQTHGIFDHNLSKYNSRNLVWNHPAISPEQMKELQFWADRQLSTSRRALRTLAKIIAFNGTRRVSTGGVRLFASGFDPQLRALKAELRAPIAAAREWCRAGWHAYEEYRPEMALTPRLHPVAVAPPAERPRSDLTRPDARWELRPAGRGAGGSTAAPVARPPAPAAAGIPTIEAPPSA
jgi:radical SAM superfamily enzyme YgiQ (UPF0313 family)